MGKAFDPPTEKEVAEHMVIGHHVKPDVAAVQADQFMGWYEARDWYVGKAKMKSWKGAVRQWCSRLGPALFDVQGKMLLSRKIDHLKNVSRGGGGR